MENCIFCKIVSGEIPANKIYEDDKVIGFLDIHPKAPGHTLLIPKDHHRWFIDLPDPLYTDLFLSAKALSQKLKSDYQADYVRMGIVGTDVEHVHIHLIPLKIQGEKHEKINEV
jgi:histidine triad (HIT) family protein